MSHFTRTFSNRTILDDGVEVDVVDVIVDVVVDIVSGCVFRKYI